ncbi:bifunctional ADP-dependent NAD(P)H-hydrate dehydratase/NAD(P)H-hydrate epimerase [soil metagenome]
MGELPVEVYTAAQVRELDRLAIEDAGMAGFTLMTRAGQAAFSKLRSRWPRADRLLILCGGGNNAGDGYVVAHAARDAGLNVRVAALVTPDRLRGDAARAYAGFTTAGGTTRRWRPELLEGRDLIVDAILGSGLERPLEGELRATVECINRAGLPLFALDLPTGLHADTGAELAAAARADATMSFIGLKLGYFLGAGPDCVGELYFDGLGVPAAVYENLNAPVQRLTEAWLGNILQRRRPGTHKGEQGHALVIGGRSGMGGAIRMTAEAALRAGAGLVTVATAADNVAAVTTARPELMVWGIEQGDALEELIDRADVVAIGPGLGTGAWGRALWRTVLASERPLVVDADALNLLAADPVRRARWILTPHPGEAGRLLARSTAEVQADRLGSVRELTRRFDAVAALKGAGTLIADGDSAIALCDRGNAGMASAGMGDVLTGVIAGLAAGGRPLIDAARAGVLIHALAGDDAAAQGERGMLATDLFAHIRRRANPR